jgi:predicted dehydrogenase
MKTEDFLRHEISRRQFLNSSAKTTAGVAAGMVGLSARAAKAAPSERLRVAGIGIRGQGRLLTTSMAGFPDVEIATICDIDQSLLPRAAREIEAIQGRSPQTESDFRRVLDDKSIQAVIVATPDHWHAPITLLACQAGKDV